MRRSLVVLAVLCAVLVPAAPAAARTALQRAWDGQMGHAGASSGALAVDLDTGRTLYALRPEVGRMPASVEKLWTTSTALLNLGRNATFSTSVRSPAQPGVLGALRGNLYLVGGGDPTLGDGAIRRLAAQVALAGVERVRGRVIGDEHRFDARRGVPSSGYRWSPDVEPLSALTYDRNATRYGYVSQPPLTAAQALTDALRRRGIKVDGNARVGRVPAHAAQLALVRSVPLARFLMQTNAPSDNFYAETLIKQLGYELGSGGTTAAGAAVVRRQAGRLDLFPQVYDGSGLSRADRSSPRQVVGLLKEMVDHRVFYRSLALTGRSGTVATRMRGTVAQGRCHTKTGTLHDASNLAGYCEATNGHTVAFAILMNYVYPYAAHGLQDRMVVSLVRGG